MPPITLDLEDSKTDFSTRRALNDLSLAVAKCRKIIVVTGAGISCSSGIPDFRSSDGLYNLVKSQFPDVVLKGRDLFDASLFRDPTSTAVFYSFISQLKQMIDQAEPTPTHDFIKTLETKGKLLRSYTQNIDGFEEKVGLVGHAAAAANNATSEKGKAKGKTASLKQCRNVQLHGDIHRVRCQACSADYPCTQEHLDLFGQGLSPDCPECLQRSNARVARSARALRVGSLRPAIVLYDESHPLGDEIGLVQGSDVARKPDMLIIMGTSLKVHGLKKLVKDFAKAVHSHKSSPPQTSSSSSTPPKATKSKAFAGKVIFVNKTPPGSEWSDVIDYHIAGATDDWTQRVIEEWKKMRPADWEIQQTLVGSPVLFKTVKDGTTTKGTSKVAKEPKKKVPIRANDDDNEENIPPPRTNPDAMVLSTPDAHRLLKSGSQPIPKDSPMVISPVPLSPSKRARPQSQSHYSPSAHKASLEASPSKRRVVKLLSASGVDNTETKREPARKVLFAKGKKGKKAFVLDEGDDDDEVEVVAKEDDVDDADLSMQSPPKAKLPSRSKVKPLPKSRTAARMARTHNAVSMAMDEDVFAV